MKTLLILLVTASATLLASGASACMVFPCGMYAPDHPANVNAREENAKPQPAQASEQEKQQIIPARIKCSLEKIKKTKSGNKTTLTLKVEDGAGDNSPGAIEIGSVAYSFYVVYLFNNNDNPGMHSVGVTVDYTENKSGDELVSWYCDLDPTQVVRGKFCENKISWNKKDVAQFSCTAEY